MESPLEVKRKHTKDDPLHMLRKLVTFAEDLEDTASLRRYYFVVWEM